MDEQIGHQESIALLRWGPNSKGLFLQSLSNAIVMNQFVANGFHVIPHVLSSYSVVSLMAVKSTFTRSSPRDRYPSETSLTKL